jgi:Holliday junction resolvase RusA-like endonuclease
MKACKCGSFAINNDPAKLLCDVCYAYECGRRDGYYQRSNLKNIFDMSCDIDLVSVNNKYCNRSYTLTKEYRAYKEMMSSLAAFHNRGKDASQGRIYFDATVYTRIDTDNTIKPTFDALEKIVYKNDSQIDDIHFHREKKVNERERIEIKVYEVDDEIKK